MRFRMIAVPAAIALLAGVGPALTSPAAAATTGTPAVVPWSYEAAAQKVSFTHDQAIGQAGAFSLIAATSGVYGTAGPDMMAANPSLDLLGYVNGAYAQSTQGTAYPPSWYLYTASGAKVRSKGYGNYLMNVNNPDWIASVATHCQQIMAKNGYIGCYIDMLGTASIMDGYTNGAPIDPANGSTYTDAEWLASTSNIATVVQDTLGASVPVFGNGLANGQRYFDPTAPSKQIMNGMEGALAEIWMRVPSSSLATYPTEANWLKNVDMISDVGAAGKQLLITCKAWGSGTAAQLQAWHVYAIASYLMTADGSAAFSFLSSSKADPTAVDPILSSLNLGNALGSYAKIGGVYQRNFANGKALVNPTKTAATVALGSTYTDLNGNRVSSVTLAPNQATIVTLH